MFTGVGAYDDDAAAWTAAEALAGALGTSVRSLPSSGAYGPGGLAVVVCRVGARVPGVVALGVPVLGVVTGRGDEAPDMLALCAMLLAPGQVPDVTVVREVIATTAGLARPGTQRGLALPVPA